MIPKGQTMKKTKLLLTPFLILMGLQATPSSDVTKEASHIKTGTTIGHDAKPGAPIDMTYHSLAVDNNATSDINITLTTTAQTGTMSVMLTFDENLTQISNVEQNLSFEITPNQKEYPINLQATAVKDGLYYIRLLTKIDKGVGSQLRAFAVPVYIGNPVQTKSTKIMKSMNGENISVSKAIETIKVLEKD